MSKFNMTIQELQQLIISNIYENNSEDISGSILQNILLQISNKLSDGLYFGGVVNSVSILTPDTNSFYVCGDAGTYQSFGDVVVQESSMSQCLYYDNTLEHWAVKELPIPTFDFTNISNSSLFGGVVTPNEEPIYGNDHRYFYLAFQEGRYTHFNNNYVDSQVCLFYWSKILSNWLMLALWENSESLSNLFSGKADKVNNPTNGNLVSLDAAGNLKNSGIPASDVITTVDSELSPTSKNPVQNKVIKSIIDAINAAKQDLLPDGSVFGGFAYDDMPPTYGNDHRYFYIATEAADYVYYNLNLTEDATYLIWWDEGGNSWNATEFAITRVEVLNVISDSLSGKQDVIPDLATIRSGAAAGATASIRVAEIDDMIPSNASSSNKLATIEDIERILEQRFLSQS